MTTITRGNPDPQGMRIIRSGVMEFVKPANQQVTYNVVAHDLGYRPIVNAYMRYALPGQPIYPWGITLPYVQSTGSGADVGKQNFRVNDLVSTTSYAVVVVTDPLATDTYWYTNAIDIEITYYIWSRPMTLATE